MGCDYYIVKLLQIYRTNHTDHLEIVVDREKGYFHYEDFDEDEDDYEENFKRYITEVVANDILLLGKY